MLADSSLLSPSQAIEAKFNMRSSFEWDRFIRFMDRWGGSTGLPGSCGFAGQGAGYRSFWGAAPFCRGKGPAGFDARGHGS